MFCLLTRPDLTFVPKEAIPPMGVADHVRGVARSRDGEADLRVRHGRRIEDVERAAERGRLRADDGNRGRHVIHGSHVHRALRMWVNCA